MKISRDGVYSILCAVFVVASVLATVPVLEMGTNDDWSYAWIARGLANTGRFNFNNWIGAIIGVQAMWAALLIRLFGFSFTLVRLSTLPFAAGCALLQYHLGRRVGLNPSFALFAALSLTLSPVFIPVAASFMTDVPGCFFWLAGTYFVVRAIQAETSIRACEWMAIAAVAGVVGGTVRQVIWLIPVLAIPAAGWIRRKERGTVVWAGVLTCGSALVMALCLLWFEAQPFTASTAPREPQPWLDYVQETTETFLQMAAGCLLLILPVLSLYLGGWRKWSRSTFPLAVGFAIPAALLGGLWLFDDSLLIGNIITSTGMLGHGLELLGAKPEILTTLILFLLGAALFASTGAAVAALAGAWHGASQELRGFTLLFGPACLGYALLVVYRSVALWYLFDRYLILLMPLLLIPLLWNFQQNIRDTPFVWSWALVALFAWFGISITHDYLAAERARLQAATTVTDAGIPRTHLSAGLEYDGWTELQQTGHLPDPALPAPAGQRHYPVSPPYWFWAKTPSLSPVYVLTYSRLPGLVDSQFPPVSFTTWLPPFRRRVFTQKISGY